MYVNHDDISMFNVEILFVDLYTVHEMITRNVEIGKIFFFNEIHNIYYLFLFAD